MATLDLMNSQRVHPARSGPRPMTAEDLWQLPRVGSPAPAPDGSACAVTVTQWDLEKNQSRARIWWVPLAGGEPRPLTAEGASSSEPAVSPDGKQLAFTRKPDGGRAQVHLLPLDGGEARVLTDLPLGAFDPQWLPDGSGLVFGAMLIKGHLTPEATKAELERREKHPVKAHVTEERFYRYWDTWLTTGEVPHLFHLDLATGTLRDLMPSSEGWFDWMDPSGQFDVSPDGAEVAYAAFEFDAERSLLRSRVWTVPLTGGEPRCVAPVERGDDARPRYTPDGRAIVFGRQLDPYFYADRVRLTRYDRAGGHTEPIAADWTLSPSQWEFAADGTLLVLAEEAARVSLFRGTGAGVPARVVRGGTLAGVNPAGDRVWFTRQTLADPPEVHVCDADGGNLRRVTRFTDAVAARYATGEVRELTFAGAQGEPVQMYLVMPPDFVEDSKPPLVHVIHGGPHGISGDGFHFRWSGQLFAAPGYVVAMVNFQGSTSWGQDFAKRIQGAWAERPFEDVMKATDLLVKSGLVDERRMAAAGGSYGGYMAAWIAGHTDRFRCIVNHAGVADLMSQYASDVTQGRGQSAGGEAWDGLERMEQWSPVRFASGFRTPMLVIHGERDYRVPVGHGLQVYGILKAKGVPARLVYFPDENHWVLKAQNGLLWNREVHGWLKRWLES
jgi:dipeptidyl aminopeptidase/acylaminoacyl peptidase